MQSACNGSHESPIWSNGCKIVFPGIQLLVIGLLIQYLHKFNYTWLFEAQPHRDKIDMAVIGLSASLQKKYLRTNSKFLASMCLLEKEDHHW